MLVDQVRRRLAVSERALRLFRAACGVLVMLECAERWPVLRAFYSDAGALPRWAVLPTREEDPVRSGLGPSPISPQPRPSHPPSHPPTTSQWPLNDNPTRTGTDFFSLSLNVAPPLLPYVQNLIQKKKTGTLGRMHPRMVGRAAMAAAAGAGGGYMCLMPRMQLAPTHRHRCVLVLAPVDHIKMPSTRVYSRPLHAPHPILRHLDAKV